MAEGSATSYGAGCSVGRRQLKGSWQRDRDQQKAMEVRTCNKVIRTIDDHACVPVLDSRRLNMQYGTGKG